MGFSPAMRAARPIGVRCNRYQTTGTKEKSTLEHRGGWLSFIYTIKAVHHLHDAQLEFIKQFLTCGSFHEPINFITNEIQVGFKSEMSCINDMLFYRIEISLIRMRTASWKNVVAFSPHN
jgi:hypothetical protein